MIRSPSTSEAFRHCEEMAKRHYENFPVASFLVPRELRPFVWAVYAFARTADDAADEGSLDPAERLRTLDAMERSLDAAYAGEPEGSVFVAIAETAARTGLPKQPLADLLAAFRQDVTTTRYPTFDALLRYCRYSANPVGMMVLHIFGQANGRTIPRSDEICTALQLTNFWQDVRNDLEKGRIYLPLEDLSRFGYTEKDLHGGIADGRFRSLMRFEIERTRALFARGRGILGEVSGRLRWELDLTLRGGMEILSAIERAGYDVFTRPPRLGASDWAKIVLRTATGRDR